MRIRLKIEYWRDLPTEKFIPEMRAVLKTDPKVICSHEFTKLITRQRQEEIIAYFKEGKRPWPTNKTTRTY